MLGCEFHAACSVSEAEAVLSAVPGVQVVVCQHQFEDGGWQALVEHCRRLQPQTRVILLSENAATPEVWRELLLVAGSLPEERRRATADARESAPPARPFPPG